MHTVRSKFNCKYTVWPVVVMGLLWVAAVIVSDSLSADNYTVTLPVLTCLLWVCLQQKKNPTQFGGICESPFSQKIYCLGNLINSHPSIERFLVLSLRIFGFFFFFLDNAVLGLDWIFFFRFFLLNDCSYASGINFNIHLMNGDFFYYFKMSINSEYLYHIDFKLQSMWK